MTLIRNSSKLLMLLLVLTLSTTACKSKKKAMEANRLAAEKARMEQEALNKKKEDEQKRKEAEEQARREAEATRLNEAKVAEPKTKLNQYFNSITGTGNVASANNSINEALGLFSSPETPVLIIISEENGQKDYDRPTTIKEYLNYLKDQKKNVNTISDLKFDSSGKISEVELKKPL